MPDTFSKTPVNDKFNDPNKRSFVMGQFPVGEARFDLGDVILSDYRRREAIYFIAHPYNERLNVDPATTVMQTRMFGSVLMKKGGVKQLTLVSPVGVYDLNHSARRHARQGFIEGDSLKMYLEDLARAGYNEIITIASHSDTTEIEANNLGMNFRDIDPFRGKSLVPNPNLGPFLYTTPDNTELREDHADQIAKLMPFVDFMKKEYGEIMDGVYFVAPDDGSETTTEQFAYACRGDKQNILAIIKERTGPGKTEVQGVKSSSTCRLEGIKGKVCVIADDRRLSGGTLNELGRELHEEYGAKEVVALIAHDMSYNTHITKHKSIDKFVFLETNPNSPIAGMDDKRIYRLPMKETAMLLAAEIFNSYTVMRERGKVKVR